MSTLYPEPHASAALVFGGEPVPFVLAPRIGPAYIWLCRNGTNGVIQGVDDLSYIDGLVARVVRSALRVDRRDAPFTVKTLGGALCIDTPGPGIMASSHAFPPNLGYEVLGMLKQVVHSAHEWLEGGTPRPTDIPPGKPMTRQDMSDMFALHGSLFYVPAPRS